MTEQEYIVVTNRTRVTSAKNLIADCTAGDDFGISTGQRRALLDILYTIEARLFKQTEASMEHEDAG